MYNFDLTNLEELLSKFPSVYTKNKNSNLGKLLNILLTQYNELKETNKLVNENKAINLSFGKNLDKHGQNVGQQRGALTDELYKALIKSKQRINKSPGDINSLIDYIATAFSLEKTDIKITQSWQASFRFASAESIIEFGNGFDVGTLRSSNYEAAAFTVELPPDKINELGINYENVIDIINFAKASGVNAILAFKGTFSFASAESIIEFGDGFDVGELGAFTSGNEEILPEV